MPRSVPVRALLPTDANPEATIDSLGRQLQMLIAQGDSEWVRGIAWQVNHRIQWVLERERRAMRRNP
jgi:hypothetical protein